MADYYLVEVLLPREAARDALMFKWLALKTQVPGASSQGLLLKKESATGRANGRGEIAKVAALGATGGRKSCCAGTPCPGGPKPSSFQKVFACQNHAKKFKFILMRLVN